MTPSLRTTRFDDEPALLALNNAHSRETSELDLEALRDLFEISYRVRVDPACHALCIALDQDAPYRSPNFTWFAERYGRFVYVDRIIVAAQARGRGLARALYEDLISAMRADGHAMLCCEVNSEPPNPDSDRFHAAFGFEEAGTAILADRGKTVRYLTLSL